MANDNYDEASAQAWPSFVDILSSTIVVLCFALLIVVIVLSVTKITASTKKESNESSPSAIRVESDILGEYRAEFQKLAIIANPSLRREMEIQSDQPSVEETIRKPIYVPESTPTDEPEPIREVGDSVKEVLGDIPKKVDTRSVEVLKELIIVQRDVIEQQRKVIEQQDDEIEQTVREYQSLLSLVTKEKEVEDIRQKINPKPDSARFVDIDSEGEMVMGPSAAPKGQGTYILNPTNIPRASVDIADKDDGISFTFRDNAAFLQKDDYAKIKDVLSKRVDSLKAGSILIEAKMSDFALSGAESQRMSVERLLVFRSLLIDLGVSPSLIKLKTLKQVEKFDSSEADSISEDESYGWVSIKKNN